MYKALKALFLFISVSVISLSSFAQVCKPSFEEITSDCVQSIKFPEATKKNQFYFNINSELLNNVFFYQTAGGAYGKLKIIGVIANRTECTLQLSATTFIKGKTFLPNTSISVNLEEHRPRQRIFLDREGGSTLELIKQNGNSCVLTVSKGSKLIKKGPDFVKEKEQNQMLFFAPLILIFVAIFLIVRVFMEEQEKFKTSEALEEAENTSKGKAIPVFLKITKPFYKRYFLPMVQGFKNKAAIKAKYRQKLANAGMLKELTPEEFLSLKIFMILGGPFVFLTVRYLMEEQWSLWLTPIMGVAGYFYPDMWLSGMVAKRGQEIIRAMPFIVDMLALSVEAGLDFMAAIQRVIEKAPPSPLVEEFETLIKETKIGSSRAEGLRQLGWRVNIIEVNSFCATLIAADSVGASIAPILKQLSNELRVKRSSRAEQAGSTAATKMLIPMIFFILPAVMVAIFAPMVLQMMKGGGI